MLDTSSSWWKRQSSCHGTERLMGKADVWQTVSAARRSTGGYEHVKRQRDPPALPSKVFSHKGSWILTQSQCDITTSTLHLALGPNDTWAPVISSIVVQLWYLLNYIFIEVKFIQYTRNYFKVSNSVTFSTFIILYNHHFCEVGKFTSVKFPNIFITPK